MTEPYRYRFRSGTVVECWPSKRHLRTVFPDGSVCTAQAQDAPEGRARAVSLGYGDLADPVWRMTVEHEVAHTRLAEHLGLDGSPALRRAARGEAGGTPETDAEERVVLALQRLGAEHVWHAALDDLGADAIGLAIDVRRIADKLLGGP